MRDRTVILPMSSFPTHLRALLLFAIAGVAACLSAAPSITQQPQITVSANSGQPATFSVQATGTGTLRWQWRRMGGALAGQTAPSLTLTTATVADSGSYDVVVTDDTGTIISTPSRLIVAPRDGYPDTLRLDTRFAPLFETEGAAIDMLAVGPDGGIYVSGDYTTIVGVPRAGLVRFKPDLTRDPGFVSAIGGVSAVVFQPDGKLLVQRLAWVSRLNSDGSLDPSFTVSFSQSGKAASIKGIALQSDGKVLVLGDFDCVNGVARSRVVRLNADGSLDQSFSVALAQYDTISAIKAKGDRAVLLGLFNRANHTSYNQLRILNSDGTVAAATPEASSSQYSSAVLECGPDGGIYLVQQTYSGGTWVTNIVRYNDDATVDSSFVSALTLYPYSFAIMADGRIAVLTAPSGGSFVGQVLQSDGSLDPSYGFSVARYSGNCRMAVNAQGRIFLSGYSAATDSELHGGLASFGPIGESILSLGAGLRTRAYSVKALPVGGGKWVVSGTFAYLNGVPSSGWARLNSDGTTDTSFATTCPPLNYGAKMVLQGDGKVLVVGCQGFFVNRLWPDGSADPSFLFSLGTGFTSGLNCVQVLPDGRIAVGGSVWGYNGESLMTGCAVFLPDGSRDTSFQLTTERSITAKTITADSLGRVVFAGGSIKDSNSTILGGLVRFDEAGRIVFPIGPAYWTDGVNAIESDLSGRLVLAGTFTLSGTPARNGFLRMNDDGSVVPAGSGAVRFNQGSPGLTVQGDGKVLVSGSFSSVNGVSCGPLIRVRADDSLDTGFRVLDLSSSSSSSILYDDDGRVLLTNAGAFRDWQRVGPLVMLKPEALPAPSINTQPADVTVSVGTSAHLGVEATGVAPLMYQWYEGASGDTSSPVFGATVPIYDTPALSAPLQLWVRVGSGSDFVDSRTVNLAIDAAQTFAQWIAASGVPADQRGELDNPAGDGVSNLMKFALGVMPLDVASAHLPAPELYAATGQPRTVALVFAPNTKARGLRYALEVSSDLDGWAEVETAEDSLGANPEGAALVRLRELSPPTAMRRFVRLKVEQTMR